jgi:flagellum-specific peptidoglycan hydrolase FlgJ
VVDTVFNAHAMENIRRENERVMNSQISAMQSSKATLENQASKLESQAKNLEGQAEKQEHIAKTATKLECTTDAEGKTTCRKVPDTAKRAKAAAQAEELRGQAAEKEAQAAALRAQATALGVEVGKLRQVLAESNRFMRKLRELAQQADMTYEQMMQRVIDATQDYTSRIQALMDSISDIPGFSGEALGAVNYNPDTGFLNSGFKTFLDGIIALIKVINIIKDSITNKIATIRQEKVDTIDGWLEVINNKNIEEYKRDFVISILDILYDKSFVSGIPIELMFGQMMMESSYGVDPITQNANNYYGMKGVGPAGSYSSRTTEETSGGDIKITDNFRAYNNISESIDDYIGWIDRNVTPNVKENTPQGWADALEASPYATRTGYGNSVLNVANYWGVSGNW